MKFLDGTPLLSSNTGYLRDVIAAVIGVRPQLRRNA